MEAGSCRFLVCRAATSARSLLSIVATRAGDVDEVLDVFGLEARVEVSALFLHHTEEFFEQVKLGLSGGIVVGVSME